MVLAAVSGLYLYQTKHRTRMLDRDIARTLQEAEAMRSRSGVLRAEWEVLNQPDRLASLASQFLALKPLAPSQFVALADLDRRLPAVQAAPPPADATAPASGVPVASAGPAPAGSDAAPVADAAPAKPAPAPTPAPAPASAPIQLAVAHAPPRRPAPRGEPDAGAIPFAATVAPRPRPLVTSALAMGGPRPLAPAVPMFAPMPVVASALGGGTPRLAPPVPVFNPAASPAGGQ